MLVLVLLIAPILCHAQLERNEVAALAVADFTQPSAGKFVSGWNAGTHITQASRAGIGGSFEYRFWLGNGFAAGLLYTGTPTNSKLTMPDHSVVSWPISRNEIDLLLTRELKTVARRRISPYVTAGGGAIVLNGGKTESGLDRQAAFIVGGGGDIRIPFGLRLRMGLTADILKASTYSDVAYRSSWTAMMEPRIGFVLPLGRSAER